MNSFLLLKGIIEGLFSVLAAFFVLRAWGLSVRIPSYDPYFNTILKITDYVVGPVNRLLRNPRPISLYQSGGGVFEWVSVVLAYLCYFIGMLVLYAVLGGGVYVLLSLVMAVFMLVNLFFNLVFWMLVISAILSWVNPMARINLPLQIMIQPLVAPIRRFIPTIGILDFSYLVLLIVIQLAQFGLTILMNQLLLSML